MCISPLSQLKTTVHLGLIFIDWSSSEQNIVNTAEIQDVEDKDMMTCEKNGRIYVEVRYERWNIRIVLSFARFDYGWLLISVSVISSVVGFFLLVISDVNMLDPSSV